MRGQIYRHDGSRGTTWRFVVDLAPDPATGRRRQRRGSGFRTRREAEAALNELLATSDAVGDPAEAPAIVRDRRDDYLVALALAAHADRLVTGDADLLELM
jgi:hypothetical protein